jgi:20S proteasome alpha/beta subunit
MSARSARFQGLDTLGVNYYPAGLTLTVAMKSAGAIILAADSRGTVGDPRGLTAIKDNEDKLFQIGNFGLGFAGASELGRTLLDQLRTKIHAGTELDRAVNTMFTEASGLWGTWFKDIPVDKRPGVLLTLAGFRHLKQAHPEPMIYLLNSAANFAPQMFGSSPCLAGVPQYAVYLVNRYYDPAISTERAKALAEYLIAETASQDPKVGGPIRLAEVTPSGYRQLSAEEVDEIHQENASLNQRLRDFFITGVAS